MKCARYGLIAIILSIVVLPLSAIAVPLDPPIAPIRQDDLLFLNFSAELGVFSANSFPQGLSDIDVSGITVNGASGLRIGPGFFAPGNAGLGGGAALFLAFDVMALNPHRPIHSVTLTIGDFLVSGSSGVDAFASSAFVEVSVSARAGTGTVDMGSLSDTRALVSDMRRLHIDSGITVVSDALAGNALASGFDVTFAQSVPEPSIVLLLVFGAGVIAAMAHKIRQA